MSGKSVELSVNLGLVKVAFTTPLEDRREAVLADSAHARSGLSVEDMQGQIESSTAVRDVARQTILRCLEVGDEEYVDVLGRLVGAACDDALIDDVSFLTAQVVKLEPAQVRALLACWFYVRDGRLSNVREANGARRLFLEDPAELHDAVKVNPLVMPTIVETLEREGFLGLHEHSNAKHHGLIAPTSWGARALLLLFPGIEAEEPTPRPRNLLDHPDLFR